MATNRKKLALLAFILCLSVRLRTVTSQDNHSGTTDISEDSNTTNIKATTPHSATPDLTTRHRPNCRLVSVYPVRDTVEGFIQSGAKLIEMDLALQNYPSHFLSRHLRGYFSPSQWVRSMGRTGRSLLVLEDNYDFMSLFFLSMGVYKMNLTLTDLPKNCVRYLNVEDTLFVIREILLNDFRPAADVDRSLGRDQEVCNLKVHDNKGYADFRYICCHKSSDGDMICDDVAGDAWIDLLLTFIVITKVLVVLYSPFFLPESLYRLKYVAAEYIYHIPDTAPVKHINVVVTQYPGTYGEGNKDKVVRLSEIKEMEYFKAMVDTNMHLDKMYQVIFDRVRLSVKSRRLLSENYVPVSIFQMLYNNLLRCRIRHLPPFKDCCDTDLLGRLNPGVREIKWAKCCRMLATVILLLLLATPWLIRMYVFFSFEIDSVQEKKAVAKQLGLTNNFRGSFTLYLTPLHGLFILMYIIFVVDFMAYGVLSKTMKEKLKYVLRKCLRDMRERSRIAVCAWTTRLLIVPFQMFGIVGLLLLVPYLLIILPLTIPVVAFYLLPAVNLTVRLLIHLFLFLCPARIAEKWERITQRFSNLRTKLELQTITAEETFEQGSMLRKKDLILQIVVIFMCLLSFWSLTLLLMEIVSFFVEMVVYILMGIIVNAGATMQFVTVVFLTVMYGRSTFNEVYSIYLTYHKKIHGMLLEMKREEINRIARKEALDQENTALRVQGDAADPSQDTDIRLIVKEGKPRWRASSMLLFLDRHDTPFIPEKFFYDFIELNYCGCPGPLYALYIKAMWSYCRILLFLFFVFIVVMAFGDAYSVSTTNQLLATVAGGFIPFVFRNVFASSDGVHTLYTDSVQFRSQFHNAINRFMQNWPIFDIIPIEFGEPDTRDSLLMNSNIGITDQPAASNHSSPNIDIDNLSEEREEEADDDIVLEENDDSGGIDIIIDVSTTDSRRRGPLDFKEAGSVSMLGADSFSRNSRHAGGSARMYKPERAIDV